MVLKAAMWVNGVVTIVQRPEKLFPANPEKRLGWGACFWGKENTYNWFHLPITTPVILDGARPKLEKIFVLYHAQSWVKITAIELNDGHRNVKKLNIPNLTGGHYTTLNDPQNNWSIDPPLTIEEGLVISVGVNFGPYEDDELIDISFTPEPNVQWGPRIYFAAAGADFETP